jgi:hypothetical protein
LLHQNFLEKDLLEEYYQRLLLVNLLLHHLQNLQLNLLNLLQVYLLYLHLHHLLLM